MHPDRCGTRPPKDDPNHLGLRCNALPEHQMALITSGCVPLRRDGWWPNALPGHRAAPQEPFRPRVRA